MGKIQDALDKKHREEQKKEKKINYTFRFRQRLMEEFEKALDKKYPKNPKTERREVSMTSILEMLIEMYVKE